jgi:phosphatidylserine/phosphatidylglycerophosphate/cardiolipin synthase-like enzyme
MAAIVRIKKRGPLMHLKAYAVDGVRTRSANLSPSGLKQQDNDLIILRDPPAAARFEARFDQVCAAAEPMRVEGESKKSAASIFCRIPSAGPGLSDQRQRQRQGRAHLSQAG